MKKKLKSKAIVSLILSGVLFTMPVGAFVMNSSNVTSVFASDGATATEESSEATIESSSEATTEPTVEPITDPTTESSTESSTEETPEEEKKECTCKDKCSQYEKNKDCPVCSENYEECAYVEPNVKVTINTPSGWHNDTTKVRLSVEDTLNSGNFQIQKVEAKIAQNGSWTDVTDDMYIEISENCTVYVRVTDQKSKTYEKNRYIKCFDFTKPTLNAAVSDGLLSVQAHDTDSGIAKVYVNGYEFTELNNGVLNVRLQQFDAGYQYFTIQAMDNAGNMSEVYKTSNPYYTDPEKTDSTNTKDPAEQLPVNAQASNPSSATATVTEHTKTDSKGYTVSETNIASKTEGTTADTKTDKDSDSESENGKEFYTIQTQSEKTFYLIIDRDSDEEKVYFLTEIDENDLLNTTTNNDETLPKNSAALESAIPTSDGALSNNNVENSNTASDTEEVTEESIEETEPEVEKPVKKDNGMATWILMGIAGVLVIGAGYYFKVVRKKNEGFLDEDDEEDEDEEVYENEDEEESESDDFFEKNEENSDDTDDEGEKEEE